MSKPAIRVTVEDLASGDEETQVINEGDYLLITTEPCYLSHTQAYPKSGTHQLTIKGRLKP